MSILGMLGFTVVYMFGAAYVWRRHRTGVLLRHVKAYYFWPAVAVLHVGVILAFAIFQQQMVLARFLFAIGVSLVITMLQWWADTTRINLPWWLLHGNDDLGMRDSLAERIERDRTRRERTTLQTASAKQRPGKWRKASESKSGAARPYRVDRQRISQA